jgi:hypothetical protein
MVNLQKDPVDLTEKQNIFKKIVSDTKGDKKVSRKLRKKQRVLIKKVKMLLFLGAEKGIRIKIASRCTFQTGIRGGHAIVEINNKKIKVLREESGLVIQEEHGA